MRNLPVKEPIEFFPVTAVDHNGELKVNAGKHARAVIVMTFEMMGGVQTLAEWAMDNKSEFYTKLFTKIIGRETDVTTSDEVEEYLKILDIEAEDVTPEAASEDMRDFTADNLLSAKLAVAGQFYANGEVLD